MNSFFKLLNRFAIFLAVCFFALNLSAPVAKAEEEAMKTKSIDVMIDEKLEPIATWAEKIIFFPTETKWMFGQVFPLVLLLLGGTAIFLTIWFKFINIRAFPLALKTVQGKLTDPNAPGQITHFQALSAALSATVGLGNIAGVAVAIGLGGPGATFWMILMGLCGMTTKFCECTLGVKFRKIDKDGNVRGGAMYYLRDGLKTQGGALATVGLVLAFVFAIMCIGGTFGAGNMFQVNQAHAQISNTFGIFKEGWAFGLVLAILAGSVIIGGIVWIARVTSFLVPFMCGLYVLTALVIILMNIGEVPAAIGTIVSSAFSPEAIGGGFIGVLIQGIKRAAFSNEAGFGSAPIAHSAVKTNRPASEGIVALLEPFTDTVVVCTMTALVIIITGLWQVNGNLEEDSAKLFAEANTTAAQVQDLEKGTMFDIISEKKEQVGDKEETSWYEVQLFESETKGWLPAEQMTLRQGWSGGVWVTSQAFGSVFGWFPAVLSVAVFLFAFSTMISWSYYGEQAVIFMFGNSKWVILGYKLVFCLMAIVGGAASLGNVLRLSDAMVFGMVIPNLIGVYFLLPIVKNELATFVDHAKKQKEAGG